MDFNTAKDKLSCPHRESCGEPYPVLDISEATRENLLRLNIQCQTCNGKDHLMFDVNNFDRSNKLPQLDPGDKFVVKSEDSHILNKGDTCMVTSIAQNPLYDNENLVVGVITQVDSSPLYSGHLFEYNNFKDLIDNNTIEIKEE